MVDNTDSMIQEWIKSIIEETNTRKERREQKQNTVINLSNAKIGDLFSFLNDEVWKIVQKIDLGEDTICNQAILFVKKPTGKQIYSVPHRLNGNLERKTLRRVPAKYMEHLQKNPDAQSDLPTEIQYITSYLGRDVDVQWSEDNEQWALKFRSSNQVHEDNELIDLLKWAIQLQGMNIDGPFETFTVTFQDEVLDEEGYPIDNDSESERSIQTIIWLDRIEASPKPDATLRDHIPPKAQTIKIDPDDLQVTVNILKKHFDTDDLIAALKK